MARGTVNREYDSPDTVAYVVPPEETGTESESDSESEATIIYDLPSQYTVTFRQYSRLSLMSLMRLITQNQSSQTVIPCRGMRRNALKLRLA